jgi:hypothetical protein
MLSHSQSINLFNLPGFISKNWPPHQRGKNVAPSPSTFPENHDPPPLILNQ